MCNITSELNRDDIFHKTKKIVIETIEIETVV